MWERRNMDQKSHTTEVILKYSSANLNAWWDFFLVKRTYNKRIFLLKKYIKKSQSGVPKSLIFVLLEIVRNMSKWPVFHLLITQNFQRWYRNIKRKTLVRYITLNHNYHESLWCCYYFHNIINQRVFNSDIITIPWEFVV